MTTTVHAYVRKAAIPVDLYGKLYEFKPNEKGDVVCDIESPAAIDRLLSISEGYCEYGKPPAANKGPEDDDEDHEGGIDISPYLMTQEDGSGGEVTIDLRTLDRKALFAFVKENEIPDVPHTAKNDAIRDLIVAFFKVE